MVLKIKKNYKKILSIIIIIIGACLSFNHIYTNYNIQAQEKNKINTFLDNNNYNSINKINNSIKQVNSDIKQDEYKFIIEIPKINLQKGVYDYSSKNNNVEENIYVLEESNMPDINNSNLILASHSGNSTTSYFKNLHKVKKEDTIIIYYSGYKYMYTVNHIYNQKKNGTINITRNINYNTLTLITCDKYNKGYQLVYIAYLSNCEKF